MFNQFNTLEDLLAESSRYERLLDAINLGQQEMIGIAQPNHRLFALNHASESALNCNNDSAIGKFVADLPFAGAVLAQEFHLHEARVLSGASVSKHISYQRSGRDATLVTLYVVNKPIRNRRDEIIGVWTHCTDVSVLFIERIQTFRTCMMKYDTTAKDQFLIDLDGFPRELMLTPRQSEVLFFTLRGKTSKDIANILRLSHRTVEQHLEVIRERLSCSTKAELIEKGIAAGYLGITPESLLGGF